MVTAYVLLIVKPGEESTVADKLTAMDEVKDVSIVYGEYDVVAKVEKESMEELQTFLIKQVRAMDEVERTSTMISLK